MLLCVFVASRRAGWVCLALDFAYENVSVCSHELTSLLQRSWMYFLTKLDFDMKCTWCWVAEDQNPDLCLGGMYLWRVSRLILINSGLILPFNVGYDKGGKSWRVWVWLNRPEQQNKCKTRTYSFPTDTLKCYLLCSPFLEEFSNAASLLKLLRYLSQIFILMCIRMRSCTWCQHLTFSFYLEKYFLWTVMGCLITHWVQNAFKFIKCNLDVKPTAWHLPCMQFKANWIVCHKRVNSLEAGSSHQGSNQILKHLCSARNAGFAAVSVAERTAGFYWGFFPLVAALCSSCQGGGKVWLCSGVVS